MEDEADMETAVAERYAYEQARRSSGQYGRIGERGALPEVVERARPVWEGHRSSRKRDRSGDGTRGGGAGVELDGEVGGRAEGGGEDEDDEAWAPSSSSGARDRGDEVAEPEVDDGGSDDEAWCGGDFGGGGELVVPEDDEVLPADSPLSEGDRTKLLTRVRQARAVLSLSAGRLERLSYKSAIRAMGSIWKRSVDMTELIVCRLRAGVVVPCDGWIRAGARRHELLARVVGLVLYSWGVWGEQIVGGRLKFARTVNVTLRLARLVDLPPAPSRTPLQLAPPTADVAVLSSWRGRGRWCAFGRRELRSLSPPLPSAGSPHGRGSRVGGHALLPWHTPPWP